ncbi:endonuclease domain-containing protein [Gordonia sp. PS3]|uniref:endonuclease domain-containing protein n=1 Tax=Gordonia TaxID=2053 RepID=UPI0007853A76|nr:hypothetical protein [Gordonia sp. QH-12]KXT57225.1 hypothetical protein Y710_08955 [Gordonia sp. QH-12]
MERIPDGVYPHRDLLAMLGRADLDILIREKTARRVRHGWYAVGEPAAADIAAVRRGGVISCVTALNRHGVWTPEDHRFHVRGNSSAVRNRKGPFCRQFGRPEPECGLVDDVPTALRHAARCLDDEGFVVVCDSILNKRLMTAEQIEYQFRAAPRHITKLIDRCDGRAESGPETMTRFRLHSQNVKVRIQVTIDGLGRVDLLVGRWMSIEIDGWEFHSDRRHFQNDRTRDAIALELGYYPLRFTYDDVVFRWPETNARIMTAIRRGAHLRSHFTDQIPR